MKTIEEIRRANVALLIKEMGSSTKLATTMGKSDSQISQWAKGSLDSKTKKPRGISDDICREFEERCNKARGWMDNDHQSDQAGNSDSDMDEIVRFLSVFKQLDRAARAEVLSYAQDMARNNASRTDGAAANESQ